MPRLLPLLLAVLVAACSSSGGAKRPTGFAAPQIDLHQPGMMFFGSDGSTAVTIDVEVYNRATVPLTVVHVAVSSFGMTEYTIIPTARQVHEVIPPGERRTIGVVVRAQAAARSQTSEPLSVRAVVRMEANGHGFREVVMQRLTGAGT